MKATLKHLPKVALAAFIVGSASLLLNGILIGSWFYLSHHNPEYLLNVVGERVCNEPGYSERLRNVAANRADAEEIKKFAAASICFTDYETGKPLDLDSLRPRADAPAVLPPQP